MPSLASSLIAPSLVLCVAVSTLLTATASIAPRSASLTATPSCNASDASLLLLRETLCASLTGPVSWCESTNQTVEHDWPNQAVYMQNVLKGLLATPPECLDTPTAAGTFEWLNTSQANAGLGGSFANTWLQFQVQYYDMPRLPGVRIESATTLGRKCWAFAYLAQYWGEGTQGSALEKAASAGGADVTAFVQMYNSAIPLTMNLCEEVMANCFVNATYNPARNGTCPTSIDLFKVGFQWENLLRAFVVQYPFF